MRLVGKLGSVVEQMFGVKLSVLNQLTIQWPICDGFENRGEQADSYELTTSTIIITRIQIA
jgi:hypothetical protein